MSHEFSNQVASPVSAADSAAEVVPSLASQAAVLLWSAAAYIAVDSGSVADTCS